MPGDRSVNRPRSALRRGGAPLPHRAMRLAHRQFKQRGVAALNGVVTRVLLDKQQRKVARVEFVPLKRQYLHLAPLVGVA